jgi:dihydrofolate reductase
MRARCSVFIATSLDGFISRPDGGINWLDEANKLVPPGEDCGYKAFIETIDVLLMGRNTFDLAIGFPEWPYRCEVVVLTHRPLDLPEHLRAQVSVSAEAPRELVQRLSREGKKRLYIDGGKTIQGFLAEGLIDDLTITVIPILLGSGRPLFGALPADRKLALESSKAYDFGFVQSTYRVLPNS